MVDTYFSHASLLRDGKPRDMAQYVYEALHRARAVCGTAEAAFHVVAVCGQPVDSTDGIIPGYTFVCLWLLLRVEEDSGEECHL